MAFNSLPRNRRKPKPVSLSIVKEYAEPGPNPTMSMTLASNGWWQKLMKRNSIGKIARLHGEAGDVYPGEIKERIQDIKKS